MGSILSLNGPSEDPGTIHGFPTSVHSHFPFSVRRTRTKDKNTDAARSVQIYAVSGER